MASRGSFETNFVFNLLDLPGIERFNVLSTTSSGHGNIATTRRGDPLRFKLTGSAFEIFTDCVPDLAAWLDFAQARSRGPIVLWGHSLGSSKVTHYLAQTGDPRVAGLVLASPSDVTGGFMDNVGRDNVPRFIEQARAHVAAGRPEQIMPDDCVIGLLKQRISAGDGARPLRARASLPTSSTSTVAGRRPRSATSPRSTGRSW